MKMGKHRHPTRFFVSDMSKISFLSHTLLPICCSPFLRGERVAKASEETAVLQNNQICCLSVGRKAKKPVLQHTFCDIFLPNVSDGWSGGEGQADHSDLLSVAGGSFFICFCSPDQKIRNNHD
jgi:hypothetical protein